MRQCPRDEVQACYREALACRDFVSFGQELPKPCNKLRTRVPAIRTFAQPTIQSTLFACQRKTLLSPLANAAIHGGDIRVSHSLQGVSSQRGAESATAVQNQGGAQVRYTLLHVPFKNSLAKMHGRR